MFIVKIQYLPCSGVASCCVSPFSVSPFTGSGLVNDHYDPQLLSPVDLLQASLVLSVEIIANDYSLSF